MHGALHANWSAIYADCERLRQERAREDSLAAVGPGQGSGASPPPPKSNGPALAPDLSSDGALEDVTQMLGRFVQMQQLLVGPRACAVLVSYRLRYLLCRAHADVLDAW